jgi:Mor family transcriptional regulator
MSDLPEIHGVLAELASEIGRDGALTLARVFGGRKVYVPETMSEDHKLAALIGFGPASTLSTLFGSETIEIPLGPFAANGAITRAIRQRLVEGELSNTEIAERYRCTVRWVRQVKADMRAKTDPNQLGLFDEAG